MMPLLSALGQHRALEATDREMERTNTLRHSWMTSSSSRCHARLGKCMRSRKRSCGSILASESMWAKPMSGIAQASDLWHATCWKGLPEFSTNRPQCGGALTFPLQTKASRCWERFWGTRISWQDICRGWNKNSRSSWTESHPCLMCNRHGCCCCIVPPHGPTTSCGLSTLQQLRGLSEHTMRDCGSVCRASFTSIQPNARRQSETQHACRCLWEVWGCAARSGREPLRFGRDGQTVSR